MIGPQGSTADEFQDDLDDFQHDPGWDGDADFWQMLHENAADVMRQQESQVRRAEVGYLREGN